MTYKFSKEFSVEQIEGLVNQLPMDKKIRLVRKLEKETWAKRLQNIFDKTDVRRKKSRLSSKEIWDEVRQARREFYAGRAG